MGDESSRGVWRLAVDTGGTFTDCIAVDPEGGFHRLKILSSSALRGRVEAVVDAHTVEISLPLALSEGLLVGYHFAWLGDSTARRRVLTSASDGTVELDGPPLSSREEGRQCELRSPEEPPALGARLLTRSPLASALPPLELRLGTTRGTNALLERNGAETALFVTRGHRDLLEIGTQARPELFALEIRKPQPLHREVVEVDERLDAEGEVLRPLDLRPLEGPARELLASGVRTAGVALLHSYRNPGHERALAARLRELGFEHVSLSAELAPLIKIVPRAQTTVVDAFLAPILGEYLRSIRRSLDSDRIWVMTSAGGLVRAEHYRAKDSLLSGPAGGVVGAVAAGKEVGHRQLLTFDMGGTSTDVARFGGQFEYVFEHRVGDAQIVAPALYIETVAAGGGSICRLEEGQLRVGPQSAGASPGPASYGAGGPLTLTDTNLLLGRLDPARFEIPLDEAAARAAAAELRSQVPGLELDDLLAGFLQIANERMADAMRRVSVQHGYDPGEHQLVAFGGAGAQHACAVAEELGVLGVVVPVNASLLSALGLRDAVLERFAHRQVLDDLQKVAASGELEQLLGELAKEALASLAGEGLVAREREISRRIVRLRFLGQESALDVETGEGQGELERRFLEQYRETFGYVPQRAIEVESVRVVAASRRRADVATGTAEPAVEERVEGPTIERRAYFAGEWRKVPEIERQALATGQTVTGPCLITERHSTTVVEPGWRVRRHEGGALLLERDEQPDKKQ